MANPGKGKNLASRLTIRFKYWVFNKKKITRHTKKQKSMANSQKKILINRTCLPKNPDDKLKDIKITVLKILKELK